jgi:hypothetical protein
LTEKVALVRCADSHGMADAECMWRCPNGSTHRYVTPVTLLPALAFSESSVYARVLRARVVPCREAGRQPRLCTRG